MGEWGRAQNRDKMNPERQRVGNLRAKRILAIWRATESAFMRERDPHHYDVGSRNYHLLRRTPAFCSGLCCDGHRRFWYGPTRQERIADIQMNEQLDELGEL